MKTNFFPGNEFNGTFITAELGNIMDIFHWKSCEETMILFTFMFLLLSCIIKAEAKILDWKSVTIFPWEAEIMWNRYVFWSFVSMVFTLCFSKNTFFTPPRFQGFPGTPPWICRILQEHFQTGVLACSKNRVYRPYRNASLKFPWTASLQYQLSWRSFWQTHALCKID